MNEKVTLQAISDIFSSQYGVSKKVTDAFGKSFFDTIVDGLNADGQVKIKGLGTFKIVDVSSRESVNVTNGERIVIDGYKKVSFTPDELAEQKKAEVIKQVEDAVAEAGVQSAEDTKAEIEAALQKAGEDAKAEVGAIVFGDDAEPENVEVPKDELSGIDMLISTPESVDEVAKDMQNAKDRADQTLEEAKKAQAEYRRLELLLDRLQNNQAPEALIKEMAKAAVAASTVAASAAPAVEAVAEPLSEPETADESPIEVEGQETPTVAAEEPAEEPAADTPTPISPLSQEQPSHNEALQRYLYDQDDDDDDDDDDDEYEDGGHRRLWIILAAVVLILAGVAYYLYRNSQYEVTYDMEEIEAASNAAVNDSDSIAADSSLVDSTATPAPVDDSAQKKAEEAKKIEEAKKAAEAKKAEEAKRVEDAKKAAEEKKKADEDKKKAAEAKKAEEAKKAAEAKKAEEAKKAAETKKTADSKKASTPKTHVLAKGQSLTRISQMYYGTKDSVRAIIRINNFKNPDNVPVGAVVKLP